MPETAKPSAAAAAPTPEPKQVVHKPGSLLGPPVAADTDPLEHTARLQALSDKLEGLHEAQTRARVNLCLRLLASEHALHLAAKTVHHDRARLILAAQRHLERVITHVRRQQTELAEMTDERGYMRMVSVELDSIPVQCSFAHTHTPVRHHSFGTSWRTVAKP